MSVGITQGFHDEVLLELRDRFLEERLLDGDLIAALFLMSIALVVAERELAASDDLTTRQHDGALHNILQLADVAGPVVLHEALQRFLADRRRLRRCAVTVLGEEMLDEG